MKKYRVTYTIVDGEHEYADEIVVAAERMTDRRAVREIADCWACCWPGNGLTEEQRAFERELLRDGSAFLYADPRAISDVTWEAIKPVVVIVRQGRVENIQDLPGGLAIKVVDWDTDELNARGRPVPSSSVWGGDQ